VLDLTCTGDATGPSITCRWSAATDARATSYRLTRRTGDGQPNAVYSGTATTATTSSPSGARWFYSVVALATDGSTVATSPEVTITCC